MKMIAGAVSYRQSTGDVVVALKALMTLVTRMAANIALFGVLSLVWAVVFEMALR